MRLCFESLAVLTMRRMSLARGRPFVVPVTRLIKDCDSWYRSAVGDPQDGHLVSMAVLRRDLVRPIFAHNSFICLYLRIMPGRTLLDCSSAV
jgi:hypothetical protein